MRRAWVLAAVLGLVAGAPVALGQGPLPERAGQNEQQAIERYAADTVLRLALLDLRSLKERTPTDFDVTTALLRVAQGFAPGDADIARRRAEAAFQAGNEAELLAATELIVRQDPADEVALLRLLTRRIAALQTSEERLAAYDRAIASERLSPAVRSRMAMDAAQLLKERGDDEGYLDRLKQACKLDSTNKDAALLAFMYYAERSPDTMGRLELLSNLLMADPLDARVLEQMRDELAAGGAFQGAQRLHEIAFATYRMMGVRDTMALEVKSLVLHWRNSGARSTLDSLNAELANQRANVDRIARQQGAAFIQNPEDVRIAEPFEEVRLAAAIALGRAEDVIASVNDMTKTLEGRLEVLRDRMRWPKGVTEEQVQELVRETAQQRVLWQCLAATLMPEGGAAERIERTPLTPEATSPLVEAWIALRDREYEKAGQLLDNAGDSLWTELGRAVLAEKTVNDGEAARAFRAVGQQAPLTPLGAMASDLERAKAMRDGGARPLEDTAKLENWVKTIPSWVDTMALKPNSFQSLIVEPLAARAGATEQVKVRVRLRNLSPVPMALGAGRTINTRLLFLPSLMGNKTMGANMLDPEVIEVDRRLRLMPNEEMECVVSPEVGLVGYALEQASYFPSRLRWRVVQGFEVTSDGAIRPGLGCLEAQIDPGVLHESLPETRLSSQELERRLNQGGGGRLPELLVAARIKLLVGNAPGNDRLADTIVRLFPTWSPAARAAALASLPSARQVPALMELDRGLAREQDIRVLTVALVTRTYGPDDPVVRAAEATGDQVLVKAVAALKARYARSEKPSEASQRVAPDVPAEPAPVPTPEPSK